jgi:hypothetical protein
MNSSSEQDPEKACPRLDPGWKQVFGQDHAQNKNPAHARINQTWRAARLPPTSGRAGACARAAGAGLAKAVYHCCTAVEMPGDRVLHCRNASSSIARRQVHECKKRLPNC